MHEPVQRPFVILNAAMTLDGKIATRIGDSEISSSKDLREVHKLRARVDAVMVGIGTQLKDDPRLTVHRVKGKNPMRVVIDSLARTSPKSRVLTEDGHTVVAVTKRAPESRVVRLRGKGATVIRCGTRQVDLVSLLTKLREMGVRRLLLEGGGNLNYSMLTQGLVDEVRVTVAPLLVGGEKAKTLVEGVGIGEVRRAVRLSLVRIEHVGQELRVRYRVMN
jgi:2,5-diamino-6-(ribosylamino)-4(3H)-pyrimidinone 5'-phosphate reductase